MMTKIYYRFDGNGYYLEPVIADYTVRTPIYSDAECEGADTESGDVAIIAERIITGYDEHDEIPPDVTDVPPPQPCWMPRWDGQKWVEDAPPPDCDPETEAAIWDGSAKVWSVVPKPAPLRDPMAEVQCRLALLDAEAGRTEYAEELIGGGGLTPEWQEGLEAAVDAARRR
ncbi:MAG: hypothetical protein LBH28_03875 [Oscillospiraceae bacterium]|jgi:hypothetical protein|nr:hypothetical protein [Oscillospiraceae bacterium]